MTSELSRDELVARVIKAGELEVERGPEEEIARYFDTERFRINSAHKSLQTIAANRYGENALSLARITDEQYGAGREL